LTCLFPKRKEEEQGRVVSGNVFVAEPYSVEAFLFLPFYFSLDFGYCPAGAKCRIL